MGTAYFYVNGPVAAFVRIPGTGAGPFVGPAALKSAPGQPTFLGHCDKAPQQSEEIRWKPCFSSQTGEVIPADKLYMGQEIRIILPLARFDYDVVQLLRAAPRHGRGTAPGTETYLDIGALLQRNGLSFELWLKHEFAGTINASAYPNLPPGMYFLCCNIAGIYPTNPGRDTTLMQLMIEANWVQAHGGGGVRVCYSQDPSYFSGLPAVQ